MTARVRALSIHADYRCRSSGACCRSGWDIPVEPEAEARIRAGLAAGRLDAERDWSRPADGLPHGSRVVLRVRPGGDCIFLERGEPRLCAVHRQLGEEAMPPSCRQFPRVATLTPLGVSITLSHYCPTAAAALFREDVPLAVVEDPEALPRGRTYEGLDARDAFPPLLRPGVLMDWPSLERWERHAVATLAEPARTPEQALDLLAAAAETARRWTPPSGAFLDFLEAALAADSSSWAASQGAAPVADAWSAAGLSPRAAFALVAGCVPVPGQRPVAPAGLEEADARWVAPSWPSLGAPLRRWLASKAFASWTQLQGQGLRTTVLGLRVALGLARAQAATACAEAGRSLDAALLKEAIRNADLLLVHLADPQRLAERLSGCEAGEAKMSARIPG